MPDEEKEQSIEEKNGYIKKFFGFLTGVPTSSLIIYIIASTPLGYALGLKIGVNFLMPFINAILIYPVYLACILRGKFKTAVVMVVIWSIMLSIIVILFTYQDQMRVEKMTIMGERYKNEMFEWLETGKGVESDITRFLPQHLIYFGIFSSLCLITGGFGGFVMGSILLNYMNYYVGCLWHSSQNAKIIIYGWSIWTLLRVIGYIIISLFLSTPLIDKIRKKRWQFREYSIYLYIGLSLIIIDIILKYLLVPVWRDMILRYLH